MNPIPDNIKSNYSSLVQSFGKKSSSKPKEIEEKKGNFSHNEPVKVKSQIKKSLFSIRKHKKAPVEFQKAQIHEKEKTQDGITALLSSAKTNLQESNVANTDFNTFFDGMYSDEEKSEKEKLDNTDKKV